MEKGRWRKDDAKWKEGGGKKMDVRDRRANEGRKEGS